MSYQFIFSPNASNWDSYVSSFPQASVYHLCGWLDLIRNTYGHKVYRLGIGDSEASGRILGVLPLVHLKHPFFGNSLVSMPFFDMGGILSDDPEAEKLLLDHALSLAQKVGASRIELRHTSPLTTPIRQPVHCYTRSHKVRMLLDLPDSSEGLLKAFKSKLRSQINRPIKDGLKVKTGGEELVEEFYEVFLENMRDLGSPVHSKRLFENVMAEFPDRARIFVVHLNGIPLAASLAVGFNGVLENPWSSALRRYQHLSPNMLLYWKMLEYAADNGYSQFDFGRSTPGEGTFKFKQQWGAKAAPLHWYYLKLNGGGRENDVESIRHFDSAIAVWKRLPLAMTRLLGPQIRKYISL